MWLYSVQMATGLQCTECGAEVAQLYKEYKKDIIKIEHCAACGEVVDKYIEYEPTVIFLEAVLHKMAAYRHLLHNMDFSKRLYKLVVIYILCATYLRWDQLHRVSQSPLDEHIFYAVLEQQFYLCCVVAIAELLMFFAVLLSYLKIKDILTRTNRCPSHQVLKAIVVSSFGRLLAIPAIIWGQTHSATCLLLTQLFILTSNTAALRAVCSIASWEALLLMIVATATQIWAGNQLASVLL